MKLHISVLEKFISLPTKDIRELRALLDDVGLEVKDIAQTDGETIFNIETLANRGDHLHALGVARELSARTLSQLKQPQLASTLSDKGTSIPVSNNTDRCLRYALMEMVLPVDLKLKKDVASVMASSESKNDKHPIVDYLNYLNLEIGHPMHAFDRDKIDTEIIVDLLDKEAEIEALDGKTYKVTKGALVIRDRKKIIAVAGVIGCANSMVTKSTTKVLIECAVFDPISVRKTARSMNVSTDASYSFERGVDPDGVMMALKRLAHLVDSGGAVSDSKSCHVVGLQNLPGKPLEKRQIHFDVGMIRNHMNLPRLNEVEITTRLKHLGYQIQPNEKHLVATVPSWRYWDVVNEDCLLEDFVRSHGFNNVKLELPPLDYETQPLHEIDALIQKFEPVLLGNGFFEVITDTFASPDDVECLNKLNYPNSDRYVKIANAVETKNSQVKITNVIHLTRLAVQNLRRGLLSFKAYELGKAYLISDSAEGFEEPDILSIAMAGRWYDNDWRKAPSIDELLSHFRGVIEGLFTSIGTEVSLVEGENPSLHPGRRADLKVGRHLCGFIGEVHPAILDHVDYKGQVIYAELDIGTLLKIYATAQERASNDLSLIDLPSIKRDITLRVGVRDHADEVPRFLHSLKLGDLTDVHIVDDFRKQDEDFRRVTYRLTFQNPGRTLEHIEIDRAMGIILSSLNEKKGVALAG